MPHSHQLTPMYDIYLEWGTDLSVGSSGDLALVNESTQTNQRVVRRLLTNPGDYIWNLDYGGGLGTFVGSTANLPDIEAVIRNQMSLEVAVPSTPAPNVTVETLAVGGYVVADITYSDPSLNSSVNLNFVLN
jgi:hypothetical protein